MTKSPHNKKTSEQYVEDLDARYPGLRALLGTTPDRQIALRYGLSRTRVGQIRSRLDLERFSKAPPPEFFEELGTTSDGALAVKWRVSPSVVRRCRKERKVPTWNRCEETERKLAPYLDLLGKVSDPKVAEKAGLSPRAVYNYRCRHGLSTKVLAPTHKDFVPVDRDKVRELFLAGHSDHDIAKAVRSTPKTVALIRTHELRLFRATPRPRLTEADREAVLRAFEGCGGNYSATARLTGWGVTTVHKVVQAAAPRTPRK